MIGHENLFCGDCKAVFEVAWDNAEIVETLEDEFGHSDNDHPAFCPFCGGDDIDDPSYFPEELEDE